MTVDIIIGTWWPARQPVADWSAIFINHRERTISRGSWSVALSPMMFRMAAILLASKMIFYRDLDEAMYGDRTDGGPEQTSLVRTVRLCHIRRVLRPLGIEIITRWRVRLETVIH